MEGPGRVSIPIINAEEQGTGEYDGADHLPHELEPHFFPQQSPRDSAIGVTATNKTTMPSTPPSGGLASLGRSSAPIGYLLPG